MVAATVLFVSVVGVMAELGWIAGSRGLTLADLGDRALSLFDGLGASAQRLAASLGGDVWAGWKEVVLNPWYWAFLAVLCVLQWRFPARRELPTVSVGLGQDLVWFLTSTLLSVTVVAAWLAVLDVAWVGALGGWSLDLRDELGRWGLPLLALVVADLMGWLSHYLHHKVRPLWYFHAVHHSQEEMNILSDSRQHVIETMITATLVFVPARALGLDAPAASALAFLGVYVGAFIHANIRTNLGPARFLVISPQAHRVHHSAAAEHIDTNFGVIFAFWDYLFGTRYHDDDEYPTTGIHDRSFPLEQRANPLALAGSWLRQNAYPFRRLAER
ncbi:MAG: sterol desaturase family protein [Microthrixaceae bacterium]|nr:sterol desaturase family protein [Microthrixaceae bacterium]